MSYQVFLEGFECYSAAGQTGIGGSSIGVGRRPDTKCVLVNNNPLRKVFANSTHAVVGLALKPESLTTMQCFIKFETSSGNFFLVEIGGTGVGNLKVKKGGTVLKSSTLEFPASTWMYLEFGLNCTALGSYEVRLNGSSVGWVDFTEENTVQTEGETIVAAVLQSSSAVMFLYVDDLSISYGDELHYNGDIYINKVTVTGNGSIQDWLTSDNVAEDAYKIFNGTKGTATLQSMNVGDVSLFTLSDITTNPLDIIGLRVFNKRMKKSDAGYREATFVLKSGSATIQDTPIALSTDPLSFAEKVYLTDPNTGEAWTKLAFNATEVGVKVTTGLQA